MAGTPKLTLVKGCGMNLRARAALAAKDGPVNVGTDFLAPDRPPALSLHIDNDEFADVFAGRDRLAQVPDGGAAFGGEPFLLRNRQLVQIGPDALHRSFTLPMGNSLSSPAGHLPAGSGSQNLSMPGKDPKQDVRHRQLLKARQAFKGKDREFADKIGVNPNYFSRLKSWPKKGSKAIGDSCRDWERRLKYPVGWFDHDDHAPPPQPELTPEALKLAEIYDDLDRSGRISVQNHVRDLLSRLAQKKAS